MASCRSPPSATTWGRSRPPDVKIAKLFFFAAAAAAAASQCGMNDL
jgi:hypothetical protein